MKNRTIRIFSTQHDRYLDIFKKTAKEMNLNIQVYHYENFSFASDKLTYRGRKSFLEFSENDSIIFRRCDYDNQKQHFWIRLLATLAADANAKVINSEYMKNFPLHSGKLFQAAYFFAKDIAHVPTYRLSRKLKDDSFPMIIKRQYGAFGHDSHLVQDRDHFTKVKKTLKHLDRYIIQPFYPLERDIRVLIMNNKPIGSVLRTVKVQKNNQIKVRVEKEIELLPKEQAILDRTLEVFNFDIAGLDIFTSYNGGSWLGEINFFPNFDGFVKVTSKNIFKLILEELEGKNSA